MKKIARPSHFFAWEALDVGFIDRTGWLAGYVDFAEGVVVVEDEFLLTRATTQDIADAVEARERALWGDNKTAGGRLQPYRRISDIDHRLIADLRKMHGLEFSAVTQKNIESDVNLVNLRIRSKQLLVSDKCVNLRRQLREGVWSRNRRDMARDSGGGHNDLLAALRYGMRVADSLLTQNPFPEGYRAFVSFDNSFAPEKPQPKVLGQKTDFAEKLSRWSMNRWRK